MTTLAAAPITCYVEPDRIHRGRKSLSLCGNWVDPEDISDLPTCPECQRVRAGAAMVTVDELLEDLARLLREGLVQLDHDDGEADVERFALTRRGHASRTAEPGR